MCGSLVLLKNAKKLHEKRTDKGTSRLYERICLRADSLKNAIGQIGAKEKSQIFQGTDCVGSQRQVVLGARDRMWL